MSKKEKFKKINKDPVKDEFIQIFKVFEEKENLTQLPLINSKKPYKNQKSMKDERTAQIIWQMKNDSIRR